jgi:hypothetical protein
MSGYSDRKPTRRGFVFGAVIVGILILIAIVLIVSSLIGGGATPSASSTPVPSSSPSTAALTGDASVCGLEAFEDTDTVTTAPVAEWVIVGTMAAPSADEVGPGLEDSDGIRSCYARTAEGALFATANIWAMGTDSRLGPLITERLVVPGPGRDAALESQGSGTNTGGLAAQIAGFKILSYDGTDATIDLAFRLNTGNLVSAPQALQWSDGDWKVLLNDDGQSSFRPSALQSLGGYIPWAGIE